MRYGVLKVGVLLFFLLLLPVQSPGGQGDLDLWRDGTVKTVIIDFVENIINESGPGYVPPEDRIATFDMDGTILVEKPQYVVFDFAERELLKRLEKEPSLKTVQPYKAVLEKDMAYFSHDPAAINSLYTILLYATDGYTDAEYSDALAAYFTQVKDARFGTSYNTLVYAPVVQLIDYLKAHQFTVYICSGSDPQFTRGFALKAAHVSPEHVIGTTVLTKWVRNGKRADFVRQHAFVKPINDKEGKPVNIRNTIGRVPLFAVGNSGGDYHMLEYSKTAARSIQLIVNHDDPDREYQYKDEAMRAMCEENGWHEISMKQDFKVIFAEEVSP
ncbi:haloacid dehalogenase-like hydrolase [Pseudodesulfovibrio sp. JC047]|uniref:HAD family hydrolase n=1 Tax=Pseudodesulfovibrio sp. JC047 TaxID=2683199 RepID=UPI0013D77B41|nr:HAD family hydrolase [Pseudodesulfovibrio sp. JC047]NDV20215.1 haloacid dehalogenase-like hydrolase [Pseudodesulfovibrio sp. JC047]